MKILFVADGRSPTAVNWMRYFIDQGHEVHLANLYTSSPDLELASLHNLPFPLTVSEQGPTSKRIKLLRTLLPPAVRTRIRQELIPSRLKHGTESLKQVIAKIEPDIVHALRIPFEGMIAALADPKMPLLISVWGNDFTLHAISNSRMGNLTRQAVSRTDALLADCQRDIRLANEWGLSPGKATIVLPGGGGINKNIFYPLTKLEDRSPIVINPRGLRSYVRNDVFFAAIPKILEQNPKVKFVCPVMQGETQPEKWVRQYGIEANVELLPRQTPQQMADLYRSSMVAVSPSEHDGTPNTLLEAMACACFPIAGDIESVREWITDGENGILVDPSDPEALAQAILSAIENDKLRNKAAAQNIDLIKNRAEYKVVMKKAEVFYSSIKK